MLENFRYFHIFNRGVDKRRIYQDATDYSYMYMLFERYLGPTPMANFWKGGFYPNYAKQVKLLSFCLMPNHFHLEVEETELGASSKLLHDIKTSYTKYFNEKYGRVGTLFESRYHFKEILDTESLINVCRYIHLNPLSITSDYEHYPNSSMRFYLGEVPPSWLNTDLILGCFNDIYEFHEFHEIEVRQRAASYHEIPAG